MLPACILIPAMDMRYDYWICSNKENTEFTHLCLQPPQITVITVFYISHIKLREAAEKENSLSLLVIHRYHREQHNRSLHQCCTHPSLRLLYIQINLLGTDISNLFDPELWAVPCHTGLENICKRNLNFPP